MIDDDDDYVDELPAPPRKSISKADRELLELAARALGAVRFEEAEGEGYANLYFADGHVEFSWNPLRFSGDALELAVRLRIDIGWQNGPTVFADGFYSEPAQNDPLIATCRAIVRAAAETGKAN
jgi:prepilin-type processing-associated H-X9-DG protein